MTTHTRVRRETEQTQKPIARRKRKVPKWISVYFKENLESWQTLLNVVRLSSGGIQLVTGRPQALEALKALDNVLGNEPITAEEESRQVARAIADAALAQAEIDRDFPVLHSLAVVGLWSWLEHFTKGFLALWICHQKSAFTLPAIQKLKIRLGDYIHLDRTEQAAYLVELLEQDLASPLKRGVTRFESLLEPFSLSGATPKIYSDALFELQQVRNVIAHRNSKADRRIIVECPWLELTLGQQLEVSREKLQAYSNASLHYLTEILYRVADLYGKNIRPSERGPRS